MNKEQVVKELKNKVIITNSEDQEKEWFEAMEEAIEKYDRELVLLMMKKGIHQIFPEEQRNQLIEASMTLRDMAIVDVLAKEMKHFYPEMFSFDLNMRNRQFLNEILSRHFKKFDLDDPEVAEWLMVMACELDNGKVVRELLKQDAGMEQLPKLCQGSDDMFRILCKVKLEDLSDDLMVEILRDAALSNSAEYRLRALIARGYDLQKTNEVGKKAIDLVNDHIKKNNYAKNRNGELSRKRDKTASAYLEKLMRPETEDTKTNKNIKVRMVATIAACVVIVGVASLVFFHQSSSDNSSVTETGTETQEVVESTTEQ